MKHEAAYEAIRATSRVAILALAIIFLMGMILAGFVLSRAAGCNISLSALYDNTIRMVFDP